MGITRDTDLPACTIIRSRLNIRWKGNTLQNVVGEIIGAAMGVER